MFDSVLWFAAQMLNKLWRQRTKTDWDKIEDSRLLDLLSSEVDELREIIKACKNDENLVKQAIIDECADIANYAMMIANKHRNR